MKPFKITPLFKDTYLSVISNATNSNIFRHNFAKINGSKNDLTQNGRLSCAFFVTSVLKIFDLVNSLHVTVKGTVSDLKRSGWQVIKYPRLGAIILWEEIIDLDGKPHLHLGFYLGNKKAISNNSRLGRPRLHHYTYHGQRKIISVFWHPRLN